ncbi:hypothetical protein [Bacillus suaedae]|uniref:Uncharacterized protein n=1 Tax=Halalkalibacter suaedae TaxID=2822140 RepID=A0A941AMV3_9BACI|nr:hypothetical protein [Bacillus suaedae]MBP3950231.1 hypothetical protein [Bacillus suaedae]
MKNESKKDRSRKSIGKSEKRWRIIDAIFTNGFFGMFYDSEKARKDGDSKRFNRMIVGALVGILISCIVFGTTFYILLQ